MNQNIFVVLNWVMFIMLVPATIFVAWKMVSDKLKGRRISSELMFAGFLVGSAALSWTRRNFAGEAGWLLWALFAAELIAYIFFFKAAWAPLKRQWYGQD